jgi:spermidine/putrescine transport system ATP-binding protein
MTARFDPSSVGKRSDEPDISLSNVSKAFAGLSALRRLSLDVHRGEFLTLLGPSGCGKTTTLRLINGFERPDSGTVTIGGEVVNETPPFKRNVTTVFQNYALFPHLTVEQNVAYGLVVNRRPKEEIKRRVGEMLERVALLDKARRFPNELSGGQMQRVALARALVNEPKVLLLDEPLGALDTKLRRAMHMELRRMHRELGITFICVTHDQEEALVMSDRIAVMKDGGIAQIDRPRAIYERPASIFVADFMGGCNFLKAHAGRDGRLVFEGGECQRFEPRNSDANVVVAVRPPKIRLAPKNMASFAADVGDIAYLGDLYRVALTASGGRQIVAECAPDQLAAIGLAPGTQASFSFSPADAVILNEE